MALSSSSLGIAIVIAGIAAVAVGYILDRPRRRQQKKDQEEYWEYAKKREAIDRKYDPNKEWNEATTVPPEYRMEVYQLRLRYRAMLNRRSGERQDVRAFEEEA